MFAWISSLFNFPKARKFHYVKCDCGCQVAFFGDMVYYRESDRKPLITCGACSRELTLHHRGGSYHRGS